MNMYSLEWTFTRNIKSRFVNLVCCKVWFSVNIVEKMWLVAGFIFSFTITQTL